MFENEKTSLASDRWNDSIACHLLRTINRHEQVAIMFSQDSSLLGSVFEAALFHEEYEICQLIKDLLEQRKMISGDVHCPPSLDFASNSSGITS